ncbi:uncharacterized protein LOC144859282 [Branchiostoma floridae x Branchiostoma japonicum]
MAEVKVDIAGRSPVKPNGAKKKTVTFVASSKKFKVTAKPPPTVGLSKITDDVTSQSGRFDIDDEDIVSSMLRSSSPSLKTRDVDPVPDTNDIANGAVSTDPEEKEEQDEPKTAKSLTDLSSCDHQFSVRVRRASSQAHGTKLSPAVLKARCVRRRINRLSGGDLFHLYTRRFMNTFQRARPPCPYGKIFSTNADAQTVGTSDGSTVIQRAISDRSLVTSSLKTAGTKSPAEMKASPANPEESWVVTAMAAPAVFMDVDGEIQFRSDRL